MKHQQLSTQWMTITFTVKIDRLRNFRHHLSACTSWTKWLKIFPSNVVDGYYLATHISPLIVKVKGQGHRVCVGKHLYRMPSSMYDVNQFCWRTVWKVVPEAVRFDSSSARECTVQTGCSRIWQHLRQCQLKPQSRDAHKHNLLSVAHQPWYRNILCPF